MTAPNRLRHAVAVLRCEGSADAVAVADAIERYLEGAAGGLTLDLALGVSPAPGKSPWWECEARERRNTAIRKFRDQHFGDFSINAAAQAIEREARRYQASAWRHDRDAPRNDRHRLLGEALQTGLPFPGSRQLRVILGSE